MSAGRNGNLIPAKKGEIKNPTGRNQYSRKRDAERDLGELLAVLVDGEKNAAQDFFAMVIDQARGGEAWAARLLWEHLLPKTLQAELTIEGVGIESLEAALARSKPATNGSGHTLNGGTNGRAGGDA